jgi:hypothetical protein
MSDETKDTTERSWDERWLEDALTNYRAAEPRPGLETRILAGLESRAVRRQRRWTFAFAALAAVLFLVLMVDLKYPKARSAPGTALGAHPSGSQRIVPDTGTQVAAQSRNVDVQIARGRRPAAIVSGPAAGITKPGSGRDVSPSGGEPDKVDVAEQKPSSPDMDQSDAEVPSAEVVAQMESPPSADHSQPDTAPAEKRSMPEIRISGLNIKPIQIKEINSAKTTD